MKKTLFYLLFLSGLYSIAAAQPPVTANLMLWLDATNGFTSSGTSATWKDLSGNANDVTTASAAAVPTFVPNAGGSGFAGVQFDGIAHYMSRSANNTKGFNNPAATLFVVRVANTASTMLSPIFNQNWNAMLTIGENTSFDNAFTLIGDWAGHSTLSGHWSRMDHPCYVFLPEDCTPAVLTGVFDAGIPDVEYWVNGTASTNSIITQGSPAPFTPAHRGILIGASGPPGQIFSNTYFQGSVLEVLAYDRVLSDTEKKQVHQYLMNKYSIPANPCSPTGPVIPVNGQIAYYSFANGSTNDLSGNNHHGVVVGAANPTTDINNSPNCAYEFHGLPGEYIRVSTNGTTDFDFASQPATISVWYKPEELAPGKFELLAGRNLGLHCPNMSGDYSLALYDCRRAVGGINQNSLWAPLPPGACSQYFINQGWQHAVVVFDWDPSGVPVVIPTAIYWNGNQTNGGYYPPACGWPAANVGDFYIGADFTGKIDEVRVYNRALATSEVIDLYQFGVVPCCAQSSEIGKPARVNSEENMLNDIKAYPNPFKDNIEVQVAERFVGGKLMLYNSVGHLVYNKKMTTSKQIIEVQKLPAGLYMIKCIKGNEVVSTKAIKL